MVSQTCYSIYHSVYHAHFSLFFCLQARGFVNYYGPQRFGSGQSVQSDQVGLALLKEDMVSNTEVCHIQDRMILVLIL